MSAEKRPTTSAKRRFRVRGTLLSEAYSSPSGAFAVHGFLSVEKDALVLARRDRAAWMRKLRVPFARVTESKVEAGRVNVEWRTDDGVISGLDLRIDDAADETDFASAVETALGPSGRPSAG
jgi:hypothetical protein